MIWRHLELRAIASALLLLCGVQLAMPLIVPQELPSILSLVYSNIPQIKKGTDSRLGFGFRLGEHADFQILVELGPQKETKPLGDADAESNSFSKRQVSKAQQLAVMRQQLVADEMAKAQSLKKQKATMTTSTLVDSSAERTPTSWLESWSKGMVAQKNSIASSLAATQPKQRQVAKQWPLEKTTSLPRTMPTAPAAVPAQALQQLQLLYKIAASTTAAPTMNAAISTMRPKSLINLSLSQPKADAPSQFLGADEIKKTKTQITAELMDVNLDNER